MRFNKVVSVLFGVLVALILISPLATKAMSKVGIRFPEWTGVSKERSNLEGRKYAKLSKPDASSISSGSFQKDAESYLADSVPMRDAVMLSNAALQRGVISLASMPHGFEYYPTFFGSKFVVDRQHDHLLPVACKFDANAKKTYEADHGKLVAFAQNHPQLNVYVLMVDNPRTATANPTQELVSDSLDSGVVGRYFYEGLPGNARAVGHYNETYAQLHDAYYRTDHHWLTTEAHRSYVESLAAMLPGETPVDVQRSKTFDYDFYGSCARNGLCAAVPPDKICDVWLDVSDLEVEANGKALDGNKLASWLKYESGKGNSAAFASLYGDYYHTDYGVLKIRNRKLNTGRELLILGNSYTNCIERFFAMHYDCVYKLDCRHTDQSADDFIKQHNKIGDVLIVGVEDVVSNSL